MAGLNLMGFIMAVESGDEMTEEDYDAGMAGLWQSGMIDSLQGSWQRAMLRWREGQEDVS